jgi:hypothetical protein
MRLYPDHPEDPYAFRVELSEVGMGTLPIVFTGAEDPSSGPRLLMDLMSFHKRPDIRNPRRLATEVFAAGAAGLVIQGIRRSRSASHSGRT